MTTQDPPSNDFLLESTDPPTNIFLREEPQSDASGWFITEEPTPIRTNESLAFTHSNLILVCVIVGFMLIFFVMGYSTKIHRENDKEYNDRNRSLGVDNHEHHLGVPSGTNDSAVPSHPTSTHASADIGNGFVSSAGAYTGGFSSGCAGGGDTGGCGGGF